MTLFLSFPLSLLAMTGQAAATPAVCASGSPTERVECLKARICPGPQSDAQLAACYRSVALALALGGATVEPSVEAPVPAAPPAHPQAATAADVSPPSPAPAEAPPAMAATAAPEPATPVTPAAAPAAAQAASSAPPAVEPTPSPEPVTEQPAPTSTVAATDDFGLPPAPVKKPKEKASSVSATIVLVEKQGSGAYLIGLDNGQLWEENEPTRVILEEGEEVKISRSFMGAYKLVPRNGRSTAVHRLRCDGDEPDPRCALLTRAQPGS